jgi:hypothetical protein
MADDNFVEAEAKVRAIILRDGPELWRNLALAVEVAVGSWVRIYNSQQPAEIQYSGCPGITENCFRIRSIPAPGQRDEKYFEVRYDPNAGRVTVTPSRYKKAFALAVQSGGGLKFTSGESSAAALEPVEMARELLKPFLDAMGLRTPRIDD